MPGSLSPRARVIAHCLHVPGSLLGTLYRMAIHLTLRHDNTKSEDGKGGLAVCLKPRAASSAATTIIESRYTNIDTNDPESSPHHRSRTCFPCPKRICSKSSSRVSGARLRCVSWREASLEDVHSILKNLQDIPEEHRQDGPQLVVVESSVALGCIER